MASNEFDASKPPFVRSLPVRMDPAVGTPEYEAWALEQRALYETRPVYDPDARFLNPIGLAVPPGFLQHKPDVGKVD
jgi:hypothetical protein